VVRVAGEVLASALGISGSFLFGFFFGPVAATNQIITARRITAATDWRSISLIERLRCGPD